MRFPDSLLDELLKDYTDPKDILSEHRLLKQLTKRVVERALAAALTAHLGYASHARHGTEDQNTRNGKSTKTVQTDTGPLPLEVPRDFMGRFVPWQERRAVAAALRAIYGAATLSEAEEALECFAERWDVKYPAISPS